MESLDLPVIWAGILAIAVFLYVVLDGFDLGLGILFPFAESEDDRTVMMNSVAPVWDGNETWLVLGGGGLFAAFPTAYAAFMPAVYMPIGFMLTALIFRGVAFEFRLKARGVRGTRRWNIAFFGGSTIAAFAQGLVLGAFVQGFPITDRAFSGGMFDWLSPFSLITGCAVVCGYVLLGCGWLIIKTEGALLRWAHQWARRALVAVLGFMVIVSIAVLFQDTQVAARWGLAYPDIDIGRVLMFSPVPIVTALVAYGLHRAIENGSTSGPFLYGVALFALGYLGLALSVFPYIVPYHITIWEAAAAPNSQALLLVGVLIMLPLILAYTAYSYWVFRGKVTIDEGYHH